MRLTIRLKILLFTLAIIVVILTILHFATSTLVAQNLEEQLRSRAVLALENVEIWLSDQKNRLLRQAEILSSSPMLLSALNDPNPIYMNEFEQLDISEEVEMMLVENVQFDWVYQLCKDPVDPGARIKPRLEKYGSRVWNQPGYAGYIPVRSGLVLSVTVPVGSERERIALLTLGDLIDQSSREDLVIMSGTTYVHLINSERFYSTTLTEKEAAQFREQSPGEPEELKPYYMQMGDHRFLTMFQALYSPVDQNNEQQIVGYLVVQFSDEENNTFLRNVTTTMVAVGALAFVLFAFVSVVFSGRLTDNLKKLVGDISAMGKGDYSTETAIQSSDEIGVLARAFGELRVKLKNRTDQLLRANKDLDTRVHEMESLNTVLVAIASENDLEEVFQLIAMEAAKQFPLDYAFLALRRDINDPDISAIASYSPRKSISSYPKEPLEQGMVNLLDNNGEPLLTPLSDKSKYPDEIWLKERGLQSAWLLPIGSSELIGFLCLASVNQARENENTHNYLRKLATEITVALQRFRINEELQLIENRLQRMFESMRDGIIQTDSDGSISVFNKAAGELLGITEDEQDVKIQDLFAEQKDFESLLNLLEEKGFVSGFAAQMKSVNQEEFEAELSLTYTEGAPGDRGLEGAIRDVTTRKKLEDQLVRSERLASMGQIAASVAHEINNPLGIILGFTQDLISEKTEADDDLEALATIEEETKRCARIVKDLLDLARADRTVREIVDLKALIERSIPLFKLHFRSDDVQQELELGQVSPIMGDEKQVQQILINVILNAIHSLQDSGGKVRIVLREEESDELKQRAAVISIEDTGSGIEPENLEKVFDPFFTTKRAGGSGLGLFIVHRLVEAHGGVISITSSPEEGTMLQIKFPIVE